MFGLCFVAFKSKAEAIKSYAAEKEDELDFEKGEIFLIDLTSIPEEGWFVAQHHGKIGIVPASFVKVIKEPGAGTHTLFFRHFGW